MYKCRSLAAVVHTQVVWARLAILTNRERMSHINDHVAESPTKTKFVTIEWHMEVSLNLCKPFHGYIGRKGVKQNMSTKKAHVLNKHKCVSHICVKRNIKLHTMEI